MNLRELIASTRQVRSNMWNPNKDFRSREFGSIIDFNLRGNYNARFKTLTVTMYIKAKTQVQRDISKSLGDTVITTHTAAITFKDIVEHVVDVQEMSQRYNETATDGRRIETVQDIINKMRETEPDLVPVEVSNEQIIFRTKIDFNTQCRVKCTCAHFYYTFAYYCAQAGAYIGDKVAPYKAKSRLKTGRYKFRNATGVPGLCKHLQLLISYILKTDNGINGNLEYSNSRIPIPAGMKNAFKIKNKSNLNKLIEQYENDEGFVAENKNAYLKLAKKDLANFNKAVKEQKAENHEMLDLSE